MRAPSEKHLEDWIVANFSRFGALVEQELVPEYWRESFYHPDDTYYVETFFNQLIARQYPLPSGRPDLIATTHKSVVAVEIKKGPVTYETLGQCLRYIYELKEVFYWTFFDVRSSDNPDCEAYEYSPMFQLETTEYPDTEIYGMVVGHGVSDKNIPIVAAACNIKVVTYEFNADEYLFTHEMADTRKPIDDYKWHINTPIGQAIRLTMLNRATAQRQQREQWEAES